MNQLREIRQMEEAGLTLIEVSVILGVLVILAAFIIPSISQFLDDANTLQTQNDAQAIAAGLVNFMKDTGQSPANLSRMLSQEATENASVDVLAGPGQMPEINHGQIPSRPRGRLAIGLKSSMMEAATETPEWSRARIGSLESYLQVNGLGLPLKSNGVAFGWNGPYITSEIGSDSWGNQYLVNVAFLSTEAGAGDANGAERRAVFVLSAGPNQVLETPFSQPVSEAFVYGDDIAVRIR